MVYKFRCDVVRLAISRRETDVVTRCGGATSNTTNHIGYLCVALMARAGTKEWTGTAWSSWESLGGQLAPNTGPASGPGSTPQPAAIGLCARHGQSALGRQFRRSWLCMEPPPRVSRGAVRLLTSRHHEPQMVTPRCLSAPLAGT